MIQAFLAKIRIIKVFPCRGEPVRTYISESRTLGACGGRKLRTDTQTHTHTRDNYSNPRCACAPRINESMTNILLDSCIVIEGPELTLVDIDNILNIFMKKNHHVL